MTFSIEPLIYIATFLAVFVMVEGLYLTVFGKSISANKKFNRRMELMSKGGRREDVLEQLRKEMNQHKKADRVPLFSLLAVKARKANIAFTPMQLVGIMVGVSVMVFIVMTFATSTAPMVRAVVAGGMGVFGVYGWVSRKAKKRISMIEEQLPDAVELMVRSLRVGHPFSSALATVSNEIKDPLATEFGVISDEAAYGRDMGEVLKAMAERLELQDMRFLAVAVTIQQQSGGNLAEILAGLAKVIRSRFRLFRRVKAITSEARFAGMFLSAFPLVALVMMNVLDPHYYDEAMEHALFVPACVAVGGFLIANIVVMKALVNIKV
ncbi:MAG: pilus assembly protein TadB [Rhodobacterales bacterium]|nr:MAG: pilus assembly protein TadB [Rhodobacterales bacterium]